MKRLSAREEEIMMYFWDNGPLFVRQILEFMGESCPHFNTISTFVRNLEEEGFVGHRAYGRSYQYYAKISREEYRKHTLEGLIGKYFKNSYLGIVSSLVQEENVSLDELKELIQEIEKGGQQ